MLVQTMELGGNIELIGFDNFDKSKLIVVKKIVGHFVKDLSDNVSDLGKIMVILSGSETIPELSINVAVGDQTFNETNTGENLFFLLDEVFKNVSAQIR